MSYQYVKGDDVSDRTMAELYRHLMSITPLVESPFFALNEVYWIHLNVILKEVGRYKTGIHKPYTRE